MALTVTINHKKRGKQIMNDVQSVRILPTLFGHSILIYGGEYQKFYKTANSDGVPAIEFENEHHEPVHFEQHINYVSLNIRDTFDILIEEQHQVDV